MIVGQPGTSPTDTDRGGNAGENTATALFVGTDGPDVIKLMCLAVGGFVITRNGAVVSNWPEADVAECMETFLRTIDRPTRPVSGSHNADGSGA